MAGTEIFSTKLFKNAYRESTQYNICNIHKNTYYIKSKMVVMSWHKSMVIKITGTLRL